MKKSLSLIFALSSLNSFAQDTGSFVISKTDFKELVNKYSVASPKNVPWSGNYFPYGNQGTDVKLSTTGTPSLIGNSPMDASAKLDGGSKEAIDWERENHSCDKVDESLKKGCVDWWGHCNGWSAAAIKEDEPRSPVRVGENLLTVADQKGIYTELWLASLSLNAGITDKDKKTADWVLKQTARPTQSYLNFWDVTPRAFFLVFTNYIGILKTGVVIDRFTGDEVWYQPVVGYKILPIKQEDITKTTDGSKSYWTVKIGMKIYWANDLDIPYGHVSSKFNINKMSSSEVVDPLKEDYEGRYLAMRLNFDKEVKVSSDGKTVISSGQIIGDGVWEHQLNAAKLSFDELNQTHPDFIWIPTETYQDDSGYGNPFLNAEVAHTLKTGKKSTLGTHAPVTLKIIFPGKDLKGSNLKKAIQKVIRREGFKFAIRLNNVYSIADKTFVLVDFPLGVPVNRVKKLFELSNLNVEIEKVK